MNRRRFISRRSSQRFVRSYRRSLSPPPPPSPVASLLLPFYEKLLRSFCYDRINLNVSGGRYPITSPVIRKSSLIDVLFFNYKNSSSITFSPSPFFPLNRSILIRNAIDKQIRVNKRHWIFDPGSKRRKRIDFALRFV